MSDDYAERLRANRREKDEFLVNCYNNIYQQPT